MTYIPPVDTSLEGMWSRIESLCRVKFKQTPLFWKSQWGVHVNSAFLGFKHYTFCKNRVGSWNKLRIFLKDSGEFIWTPHLLKTDWEFKQTLQRGSLCEFHIFKKHWGEFKHTLLFWKYLWGIHVNSTFFKRQWGVQADCTFCKNRVGSWNKHFFLKEWGVCLNSAVFKNKTAFQADSAEGGVCVNSAFFKKPSGGFKQILQFVKTEWGVKTNSTFWKTTVGSSFELCIL